MMAFTTSEKNAVFAFDHSPDRLIAFDMVGMTTQTRPRRNELLSDKKFWQDA